MRLIKLFFVAILVFGATVCFAVLTPEEDELNKNILDPIVNNFKQGPGSPSERLRKAILDMEVAEGKQFSKHKIQEMVEKGYFHDDIDDNNFLECTSTLNQLGSRIDATVYADQYLLLWNQQTANCGIYANFVLWVFEFNRMNTIVQGKKPLFRMATFAITREGTGRHVFVLVEGISGTMYAVDPWIRMVVTLNDLTTKLSTITWRNQSLPDPDIDRLNSIFSKPYYDTYYVDPSTKWVLNIGRSDKMLEMVDRYNPQMKIFYDALLKTNRFPQWKFTYNELFQKSDSPAVAKTELENKTADK